MLFTRIRFQETAQQVVEVIGRRQEIGLVHPVREQDTVVIEMIVVYQAAHIGITVLLVHFNIKRLISDTAGRHINSSAHQYDILMRVCID